MANQRNQSIQRNNAAPKPTGINQPARHTLGMNTYVSANVAAAGGGLAQDLEYAAKERSL